MAATNSTNNLGLPQWVATDKPERTDFNTAFEAIDTNLNLVLPISSGAGFHNSIFRGKYLGSSYTATQKAAVAAGTFEDLYIGDYWTIGGVNYRIAGFNYNLGVGTPELTTNHITIVPDLPLYDAQMNTTNTTSGGYVGSNMYTTGLNSAKSTINTAFSGSVLTHKRHLSNGASGSADSATWYDSTVELMNEVMVYGSRINGSAVRGLFDIGAEKSQLPLFSLSPNLLNVRQAFWLRDIHSSSTFAWITETGNAGTNGSASFSGVRPVFSIS